MKNICFILTNINSLGVWHCAGKRLAFIELRNLTANIAVAFDVQFAPNEDGKDFIKEKGDAFTTSLPPLMLSFSERASSCL